ncbi:MAG: hydrogenase formation protein HypD [Candidatus Odinarchaeia archaeon]
MFKFSDNKLAKKIINELKKMNLNIRLMHACGTHQDTLLKSGLNNLFNEIGVEIRQGPGCPVCVTPPLEIEEAIELARNGITITAFGDVVKVKGYKKSLYDLRGDGYSVHIVYSISDAVELAEQKTNEKIVFVAVGFDTTAPATASVLQGELPENFYVLSNHKYFPPALDTLLSMGEVKLDGLIQPGHVSVITGLKPYYDLLKKYSIPQVVSGFEPLDMLISVYMLAKQITENEPRVENEYTRAVREEGNKIAQRKLADVFEPIDVKWKGFPIIKKSGMKIRAKYREHDARVVFKDLIDPVKDIKYTEPKGCICNEILRGLKDSFDCKLFGKQCTPDHPVGPCMVSVEGNCNINLRYSNRMPRKK